MGSQNSTEAPKNQSNQKVQVGSCSQFNITSNQRSKSVITSAKYENSNQDQYFTKSCLSVFNNQLQKSYDECGGDFQKFMVIVEQKVSQVYSQVSQKTLKNMNNYEINAQRSKVTISEEILSLNLNILKLIGKNNNMKQDKQTFKKINQFQRNLIGYLKIKYPRDKQTPVSNDLMDKFKQFDRVNNLDYDILKNCHTYFGQIQRKKIIKGIKIFINKIIDESKKSFPQFKDKMQKIFTKKNKEGFNISLNYKIGRKIPQNCPRYEDNLDNQVLQIFSPEIFRILIKWMEDLEMTIKNTSEKINKKQNFKCYLGEKKVKIMNENSIFFYEKENKSVQTKQIEEQKELEFNYINHYENQTIVDELISKINGLKQNLEEKNVKLLNLFYEFNERLLKVLNQAIPLQKYVTTKQIETIKYSSFNSKFVEYVLTQKLVFVIEELVKVGQSFIGKNSIIFDVIKFRITDLLRCQVWSDSRGIKQIFDLFKEMQKNRQIKIIKIKNRLMTPMNDAMILFILEKSWLICEAQLILSQLEEKEDRISKNIANVNHYFYELERSPYGIMAQIAVLLTYRDNRILYQDRIKFKQNNLNIKSCMINHKQQVVQNQKQQIPFICSNCSMFYKKFQNVFRFYECKKCKIVICSKCFLKYNPQFENSFVMKKIKLQLQQRISGIEQLSLYKALDQYKNTEKKKFKNIYYKQILNLLQLLKIKFDEEFNKSKKQNNKKVSVVKLIQKLNQYYQISKQDDPRYFFVVKFLLGKTVFRLYCYNPQYNEISNPIDSKQKYDEKSQFSYSEYDLLCMFKKSLITRQQQKKIEKKYVHLFISKNQLQAKKMQIQKNEKQGKLKKNQNYEIVSIQLKNSSALLLLDYASIRNQKTISKDSDTNQVVKKNFQYTSLRYLTNMIPDLDSAKSSIQFDNKGIQTFLLKHFQELTWKNEIKQLNLANNKIDDITILLDELNSLQNFYFNNNYIKVLIFKKKRPKLQILNGTNNKISQIMGLKNIPNIKKLILVNNKIKQFPQDSQLQYLNVLNLKGNYILNLNKILECKFPQLQQLNISQQHLFYVPNKTIKQVKSSRIDIKFSKLKNFENQKNESLLQNQTLQFNSQSLERISLNNSMVNEISFRSNLDLRNLKYVQLHCNKIRYLKFLDQKNYSVSYKQKEKKNRQTISIFNDNLIKLVLSQNQIQQLPVMKFSSLKHLELQKNGIKDIKPLQLSSLPSLQYLDLGQNKFTDLCILKLPKLITFKLQKMNKLAKVNHLFDGSSQLSSLQNLYFTKTQQMYFNFKVEQKCLTNLKELRFNGVNFESTTKQETTFQIPNLEKISFDNCLFKKFPKLILPKVTNLCIEQVKAQNLLNLQKSYLPELRNLSIQYLLLINQKKQEFNLIKKESDFQQINSKSQFTCDFGFSKLKSIKLKNIKLASLHGLNPHRYPQLESFQLINTKILQNQLPNLKAPNIQQITITASQIKQIDSFLLNKFANLSILYLDNNKIQSISQETLASMTKIKILSLSQNNLKRFFCNKNLDNLIMLDLSSNKITSFPRIKAKILIDIRWYKNPLNDLSELQNCELPSLQMLQFIDCELGQSGLPKINMPGLQTLIISKSWLKNIKNLGESNLPALRQLDLSYNQISSFPPVNLPKLENLYLEQNKIDDLSFFKISKLQNLHSLRLNKNHFIKMPSNLQLQHLKIFQFSDMRIFSLPKLKLPQVQHISINQAKLADIEQFAKGQYRFLRYLDFSNNQISYLPSFQSESLTSFIFDSNKIQDLQNFFESNFNLSLIQRFSFQNNHIRKVPPIKFVNIKVIYLNNNPLEDFDSLTLPEYPYLHGIYLNKTKVKKIGLTAKFPQLQKIDLKNTQVYQMNWLIGLCLNYPRLEMIDMKGCYITKVPNLEQLKSLNRLYLHGNPVRNVEKFLEQDFNQTFEFNVSLNVGKEFQKIKRSIQNKLSDAAVANQKSIGRV